MAPTMSLKDEVVSRAWCYYGALEGLGYFCSYLPRTFYNSPTTLFTSPSTFQRQWFSTAWSELGPLMASNPDQQSQIAQLIQPNTHGIVLELGPGGGDQMTQFSPLLQSGAITKVYGVEPNEFLHPKLRDAARLAGFEDDQYIILPCGGEASSLIPALQTAGVLPQGSSRISTEGIFDTIISLKVLCSFSPSQLQELLLINQAMLRPGGKYIFFEHLGNDTDFWTKIWVWILMWVWPLAHGGCRLDCRLEDVLAEMPGWGEKRWNEAQGTLPWSVLRWVQGWVQKKDE